MKSRYFSFIALTMVLAMLILSTGCGVRINGKDYELFKASENEEKNNIFSGIVSGIGSGIGSELSDNQEILEDKQDGEQFVVSNNAGNIKFKKSLTSQIEIKADKIVRGASIENKQSILDNMNIKLERSDKVINVVLKTKDGNDFWEWQKDNFKVFQVTINFDISLPEGVNVIEASTGAGNVDIDDVVAKLALKTGAGNIDVQGVSALGDNLLSTGAGNISFDGNVNDISSFDISTGVGNVKFEVPENTKMSLEADTGVGVLSGSFIKTEDNNKFYFVGDVNGGGPSVKLNTGVGNVKADKN